MTRAINVTPIDLRKVTRGNGKVDTVIYLVGSVGQRLEWLRFGALCIQQSRDDHTVGARLKNATDFEHDSAWAFRFRAIGLTWGGSVASGWTTWSGYIHPHDLDELRIPHESLDAWYRKLPFCDEEQCTGASKHRMVPEGLYAGQRPSPQNLPLLGRRFEIHMSRLS